MTEYTENGKKTINTVKPTNVVSELSTLCLSIEQFGLRVSHDVQFGTDTVNITNYTFEVDNSVKFCHAIKVTQNYFLEGYFNTDLKSGVFSIGTGNLQSMWTILDSQLLDTQIGIFARDITDIQSRLAYVDDILQYAGEYWNSSMSMARFGTYFTVESSNYPNLPSVFDNCEYYRNGCRITVFVPTEDNDTGTFKVQYTLYYTDNALGITSEVYTFDILTDVYYDLHLPEEQSTPSTDVFEYIYNHVME
ncbi:MAG: hypothetical protein NC548_30685 [Lachnospiraceae bacterium]|nr:hypothetical protein [Lachnospiraceae bacterium]